MSNWILKEPFWDNFFRTKRWNMQRRLEAETGDQRMSPLTANTQTEATLVPISSEKPCFQCCRFPHIHFITQPHIGRFQMAQGKHSWATLIHFIYLVTNSASVCVRAHLRGKGLAVWSHVILPVQSAAN